MASHYVAVGIRGGECRWTPPIVRPASNPDGRSGVAAGAGPDPVSGSVIMPIVRGAGPALTHPDQARIRYIHQSWDATKVVHDTWRNGGAAEPAPTDDVGARIGLILNRAHSGDLWELVLSARSFAAVNGQSAVVVVEIVGD